MSAWTKTGRVRHHARRYWGGAEYLVYQVEERGLHTYCIGGYIDSEWATRWRDMTTADLTVSDTSAAPETGKTEGGEHG